METAAAYVALFGISFLAATLVPAQSELVLAGMILSGDYDTALLVGVATAGNTLGACVNWMVGRFLESFRDRRWFPVSPLALSRAEAWYSKWGIWSLLLSWAPLIGDGLTLVAGTLRVRLLPFVILVSAAKGGRYLVLAYTVRAASGT